MKTEHGHYFWFTKIRATRSQYRRKNNAETAILTSEFKSFLFKSAAIHYSHALCMGKKQRSKSEDARAVCERALKLRQRVLFFIFEKI